MGAPVLAGRAQKEACGAGPLMPTWLLPRRLQEYPV